MNNSLDKCYNNQAFHFMLFSCIAYIPEQQVDMHGIWIGLVYEKCLVGKPFLYFQN